MPYLTHFNPPHSSCLGLAHWASGGLFKVEFSFGSTLGLLL
jgi:hypothetical protein